MMYDVPSSRMKSVGLQNKKGQKESDMKINGSIFSWCCRYFGPFTMTLNPFEKYYMNWSHSKIWFLRYSYKSMEYPRRSNASQIFLWAEYTNNNKKVSQYFFFWRVFICHYSSLWPKIYKENNWTEPPIATAEKFQ